ncbi:phage tail protein [uncultured Enterobacter sp.]|uniref:phage tail fiber protein n=1 Tax=uncultured Enterobacter sp. TaxID=238202 RepID=UPI00266B8BEC|nr:phage tail protein [uncultured Enterobacter sp.]
MANGTINLVNNSTALTGVGSKFLTEVTSGDFIYVEVGTVPYTLPVDKINSDTSITLLRKFTGPTINGVAWTLIPRRAQNSVASALADQVAEAIRLSLNNENNWQKLLTETGNVTITRPDGSSYTGPSWLHVINTSATKTDGAVPVNQGGTGATNAADARTELGVLGLSGGTLTNALNIAGIASNPYAFTVEGLSTVGSVWAHTVMVNRTPRFRAGVTGIGGIVSYQIAGRNNGTDAFSIMLSVKPGSVVYTSENTTKASDGTLKAASPVVKFYWDGKYKTNDESEGCTVIRRAVGEYLIEGCSGLNADAAWGGIDGGFDIPTDRNKQPLIWLDYDVNPDGSVLVKTYHRTHPDSPEFARNRIGYKNDAGEFIETVANGDPVDIPSDQFVSVRVEMPQDSIWNQRQKEIAEMMDAETSNQESTTGDEVEKG